MNQTIQVQTNSFKSVEQIKTELIKYCYIGSQTTDKQLELVTRSLLQSCKDEWTLRLVYQFMQDFIMPYFDLNRTKFNKLRACFMRQVLASMLNLENDTVDFGFFNGYNNWVSKIELRKCNACNGQYLRTLNKFYTNTAGLKVRAGIV